MRIFMGILSIIISLGTLIVFFWAMVEPTNEKLVGFMGMLSLSIIFFLFYIIEERNSELNRLKDILRKQLKHHMKEQWGTSK